MSFQDGLTEYLMPLRTVASTFARLDTQRLMLEDSARVEALQRAIAAVVRPGDVVVEIGTGTGLLAVFAARAGARKVYAIEATELAGLARAVIAANGLAEVVEVHRGFSTELELPERGDVLITETLGHIGIDEGIVPTVADARRRLLKPDARLIPETIDILLAPTTDQVVHERELAFWDRRFHELDLGPLRDAAAGRIYLRRVIDGELAATPKRVAHLELASAEAPPDTLEATFVARGAVEIAGLAAWFESELGGGVRISSRATRSWFPLHFPVRPTLAMPVFGELQAQVTARPEGDEVAWGWTLRSEAGERRLGRQPT